MRISICQADLPIGFNKIAKYLGRHWPGGALKLSQSRECLAQLLGYPNAYAVSREVVSEEAIQAVDWQVFLDEAVSRAVDLWKVEPVEFARLLKRVPWCEIAAGRKGSKGHD